MFAPVNSDHAVSSCTFVVNFVEPLASEAIELIRHNHAMWRHELPAVLPSAGFSINITPQGPTVDQGAGVQYAFLRPDGTPAWLMSAIGPDLTVECGRYTRWEKVVAQATEHLRKAISLLADHDLGLAIAGFSLVFHDEFLWTGELEQYDLAALLSDSELLAAKIFGAGPVWHSHTAWFELGELSSTLVHFNLDGTRDGQLALQRDMRAQVGIVNLQSVRLNTPIQIKDLVANFDNSLVSGLEEMHMRNKQLLRSVLIPSLSEAIGLQ